MEQYGSRICEEVGITLIHRRDWNERKRKMFSSRVHFPRKWNSFSFVEVLEQTQRIEIVIGYWTMEGPSIWNGRLQKKDRSSLERQQWRKWEKCMGLAWCMFTLKSNPKNRWYKNISSSGAVTRFLQRRPSTWRHWGTRADQRRVHWTKMSSFYRESQSTLEKQARPRRAPPHNSISIGGPSRTTVVSFEW